MFLFKKLLIKMSGNRVVQSILQKNAGTSLYLMGIGSGGNVLSSGEDAIFGLLTRVCREPYCIFDVGANRGQFLALTLEKVGSSNFTVHCFEPSKEAFLNLSNNSVHNDKVFLNNIGLGRTQGEAKLYYDQEGSGLASLTKRNLLHFGADFTKSETIRIDTIDNYCKTNNLTKVDLLKIDVEGHELDVLEGTRNMLEHNLIKIVTFEFGGCNIDTRTFFRDFWYFFSEFNMKLLRITPSGHLQPLESYKEIFEQFVTTNFVALHGV